jgi:uncharacterized membrane protein
MENWPTVVITVAALAVAMAVLYLVFVRVARRVFGHRRRLERDLAMELLKARRDRGVITADEFETARRIIGDG